MVKKENRKENYWPELAGGEVTKVTGSEATKDINNMRLKEGAWLRVHQMKHSCGPPPCDPMEWPFEGRSPGSCEHVEHVALGLGGLDLVVLGVVGQGLGDQLLQVLVLVMGRGRSRSRRELLDQLVQLLEPRAVEAAEAWRRHFLIIWVPTLSLESDSESGR